MRKILVLHNSLNSCGGGERVCLHTIKALQEAGYRVVLGVVERTDWDRVLSLTAVRLDEIPEEFYILRKLRTFGIYQRFFTIFHYLRKKADLIINTHGDVLPLPAHITYMHFPTFALTENPYAYSKYQSSLFWRAYFEPYRILQKLNLYAIRRSVILTNSSYSRDMIKKYIGAESIVVHPPVDLKDYLELNSDNKRDQVITISRFSPEKRLHLIPYIAKQLLLDNIDFVLIGSTSTPIYRRYYRKVTAVRDKLGVENLKIIPDAPHEVKLRELERSKVYLHLMKYEHFGISVIEALASKCIPVCHASGGIWTDIRMCYFYITEKEIPDLILKALDDYSQFPFTDYFIKEFSDEKFRERMLKVVECVLSS